jgi:hypothetical protein
MFFFYCNCHYHHVLIIYHLAQEAKISETERDYSWANCHISNRNNPTGFDIRISGTGITKNAFCHADSCTS